MQHGRYYPILFIEVAVEDSSFLKSCIIISFRFRATYFKTTFPVCVRFVYRTKSKTSPFATSEAHCVFHEKDFGPIWRNHR